MSNGQKTEQEFTLPTGCGPHLNWPWRPNPAVLIRQTFIFVHHAPDATISHYVQIVTPPAPLKGVTSRTNNFLFNPLLRQFTFYVRKIILMYFFIVIEHDMKLR